MDLMKEYNVSFDESVFYLRQMAHFDGTHSHTEHEAATIIF